MVNAGWTMMVVLWGRLTAGYGDEVDPPAGIASLKSGEIWSTKIRTLHLSNWRFYPRHLNIKIFSTNMYWVHSCECMCTYKSDGPSPLKEADSGWKAGKVEWKGGFIGVNGPARVPTSSSMKSESERYMESESEKKDLLLSMARASTSSSMKSDIYL